MVNNAIHNNSHNFRTVIDINVIQVSHYSLQIELSFDMHLLQMSNLSHTMYIVVKNAIHKNSHNFRTVTDINVIQVLYYSLQRELSFDT